MWFLKRQYGTLSGRIIDPNGVDRRLRHRLQRRQYKGRRPNFLWHIDGYDKLKPFGFSFHGCIDGYSGRIMWVEVGMSNNDPTVVARYFVKCIIEMGGTARIVRADCGTENSHVAAIQRFLRNNSDDSFRAEKSEETAFSMSKINFNANDEGTILQSNRNARMTIQYKWTKLVKRGHLQELRKMRDNKQVLKIIRSVRNTDMADSFGRAHESPVSGFT